MRNVRLVDLEAGELLLSATTWSVFETFRIPPTLTRRMEAWSDLSEWADAASKAVTQAEDRLQSLLAWWDDALRDLGGDPSRMQWDRFSPLRLSREEDWSDWLGYLLETSSTGTLARELFGRPLRDYVTDFAHPTVEREPWTESRDRRGDLLIVWQEDTISHVEVKIRDTNFDKTYETAKGLAKGRGSPRAWVDHVLISEDALTDWQECAERHPEEREVGIHLWREVAEALRSALLTNETVTWRAWAWAFTGAIEQKLLGYGLHARSRSVPTPVARLQMVLGEIELLQRGKAV